MRSVLYITYIDITTGTAASGSSVRPRRIYESFIEKGYDVTLLEGAQLRNRKEERLNNISTIEEILNKKDFEFITVKEICEKAGVNRSTFYLHYETLNDLLVECLVNTNKKFITYFNKETKSFVEKLKNASIEELILITPEYLTPYLTYNKENKIIHQVAVKHSNIMNSYKMFNSLNNTIFKPIFLRFGIDEKTEHYMIAYYLNGITAIINEWIKNGCKDEIEYIEKIIINCVRPHLS